MMFGWSGRNLLDAIDQAPEAGRNMLLAARSTRGLARPSASVASSAAARSLQALGACRHPGAPGLALLAPSARFSSVASGAQATVHKPVPAKIKRKPTARHKKAAAVSAATVNGAPAHAKRAAKPKPATLKQSEEELLASLASAKKPNGAASTASAVAAVAADKAERVHVNGKRAASAPTAAGTIENSAISEVKEPSAVSPKRPAEKPGQQEESVAAATPSTAIAPTRKHVNGATAPRNDARTDKITLTLQEIAALQKTLPSVDEIAQLVARLRRESFERGHTLFDLYRNYGNPFLDENFLTPGVIACCEAKKPSEGIRIVRDMLSQGRKVDEKTLRALLDVCDETSSAKDVIQLWELMERAGVALTLQDLNRFLDICYRQEYLDGAIKVLKELRLHRPISVHTYMHWLLRSSMVWRSDAFFDVLMEMRLSGVEPEISSLTSLESGRKDRALTVMEGVRAVGLDPCFAMSSVYSSMQWALYGNGPNAEALPASEIKAARLKFGDLKPHVMDWPVKPIPQVLETQAAGLILQQETFRRLKRKQVNHIDELLQMLPITANMTLNLRKQLQRMSLLVNTHRVRRETAAINKEFEDGKSLIDLSIVHNYPPVSLMRVLLRHRGMSTLSVKRALANPAEFLSKRDQYELRKAIEYDSIHKSDPFIGAPSYNADSLETAIQHFLKARGIRIKSQEDLCEEQERVYGRRVISPDILLLDPVIINGTPIRWIDAKNYYGAHIVSKRLIAKQLASYVKEWGPGAIVFGMGYSDMFSVPGVLCLDTTPFPKTRTEVAKTRVKSLVYSFLHLFNWKKHLGSELTQEYPVAIVNGVPVWANKAEEDSEAEEAEIEEESTKESVKESTGHGQPKQQPKATGSSS